ncbi:MAG: hypothetical protein AMJ75_12740, partial [Phycisphaerae bacterium SM1_79]
MQTGKHAILVGMVFWASFMPVSRYADNQDELKSYILKATIGTGYERRVEGRDERGKIHNEIELRFDGSRRRLCCRERWWTDEPWQGHNTSRDKPSYNSLVCEGEVWLNYCSGSLNEPGTVIFTTGKSTIEKWFRSNLSRGFGVPALRGYFSGDDERVDTVLRDAARISLREQTERIGGSACWVVDAETNRGDYTIWIDPKHGYNIARAVVRRKAGNFFYGDYRLGKGESIFVSLEDVRFRLVSDQWIPVEADVREVREALPAGEGLQSKVHYKLKDVILDPDHDSLGSFVPDDIANGSKVYLNDGQYTWQNGKVVDAQGRQIDYRASQSSSLVGKTLPPLEDFRSGLDLNHTENKRVLICFWDVNQRPSRNCVQELEKKAELLADKGVFVVLVQAETVDEGKLGAWLSKGRIALPVGRIRDNVDEVRRHWG